MSRVFDKALGHKSPGYVTRYVTEAVDSALRRYAMRNDSSVLDQSRGIFLAGYGAIFRTEVDYPFAPGDRMRGEWVMSEIPGDRRISSRSSRFGSSATRCVNNSPSTWAVRLSA